MAFVDILLNGRGNKNAVIKKEKVIKITNFLNNLNL